MLDPTALAALVTRCALPLGLQSTNPRSTAVGAETCSTPVLNQAAAGATHALPDRVIATATEICTGGRSAWGHPQRRHRRPPRPSTRRWPAPAVAAATCCEAKTVGLAWASSIFRAACFGR